MRTLCVRFSPEPLLSFGGDGAVIARSPLVDLTGLSIGETGGTADASCLALDASYLPHSRSRLSRPHFPGRKDEGRTFLSPALLETPRRAALGLVRLAPLMVAQPDYTPDHGDLSKSACLHRSRLHRPSRGAWQPQHTAPGALNDCPPIDMSLSGIAARRMPIHSRQGRGRKRTGGCVRVMSGLIAAASRFEFPPAPLVPPPHAPADRDAEHPTRDISVRF